MPLLWQLILPEDYFSIKVVSGLESDPFLFVSLSNSVSKSLTFSSSPRLDPDRLSYTLERMVPMELIKLSSGFKEFWSKNSGGLPYGVFLSVFASFLISYLSDSMCRISVLLRTDCCAYNILWSSLP